MLITMILLGQLFSPSSPKRAVLLRPVATEPHHPNARVPRSILAVDQMGGILIPGIIYIRPDPLSSSMF